jgi:hypothetical protein
MNSFEATWPSYIEEPPSEAVKVQDIKQKNIIAYAEVLMPVLDPQNRCELVKWMADGVNGDKTMFSSPLEFDYDLLLDYVPPVAEPAPEEPLPESGRS